jgi:uncharacterized membrane protein YphA (DoxX/SURF4 family)
MFGNAVLADLECDVGVVGTINSVRLPPPVVAAIVTAISDIVVSLLHQQV